MMVSTLDPPQEGYSPWNYRCLSVKVKLDRTVLDTVSFKEQGFPLADLNNPRQNLTPFRSSCNNSTTDQRRSSVALTFSFPVEPDAASCFVVLLQQSDVFFHSFLRTLSAVLSQRRLHAEECHVGISRIKLNINLKNLFMVQSMESDVKWSNRILPLWTNRLILEDVFSWLSTLGGAFSSLGDYHSNCAVQAGRLSVKQLKLAWMLGDPFLQSRCMVYLSQSLMQRGYFKLARKIIRKQYQFALSTNPLDHRLVAMCEGVWTRINYSHWKRLVDKGYNVELKTGTLSDILKINGRHVGSNGCHIDRSMSDHR